MGTEDHICMAPGATQYSVSERVGNTSNPRIGQTPRTDPGLDRMRLMDPLLHHHNRPDRQEALWVLKHLNNDARTLRPSKDLDHNLIAGGSVMNTDAALFPSRL